MKLVVTYGEALTQETPLLVLGVWEGESLPRAVAGLIEDGDWNGKFKQTTLLYPRGEVPARRVLLVGMGKRGQIAFDRLCEAAAVAAQHARNLRVEQFAFDCQHPRAWRWPAHRKRSRKAHCWACITFNITRLG